MHLNGLASTYAEQDRVGTPNLKLNLKFTECSCSQWEKDSYLWRNLPPHYPSHHHGGGFQSVAMLYCQSEASWRFKPRVLALVTIAMHYAVPRLGCRPGAATSPFACVTTQ
jgi:hypothetical protein